MGQDNWVDTRQAWDRFKKTCREFVDVYHDASLEDKIVIWMNFIGLGMMLSVGIYTVGIGLSLVFALGWFLHSTR